MLRCLLILLALLVSSQSPRRSDIAPQLVAEGSRATGGESRACRDPHAASIQGWHGYWLNPGRRWPPNAGRQMAAAEGLLSRSAALSGADAAEHRRAHELCLRARLCRARPAAKVPADAKSMVPVRAAAYWLACTEQRSAFRNRANLRSTFRSEAEPPNRAQFDEWRQGSLPRPLIATIGHFDDLPATSFADRNPASVERRRLMGARIYVFPHHRRWHRRL